MPGSGISDATTIDDFYEGNLSYVSNDQVSVESFIDREGRIDSRNIKKNAKSKEGEVLFAEIIKNFGECCFYRSTEDKLVSRPQVYIQPKPDELMSIFSSVPSIEQDEQKRDAGSDTEIYLKDDEQEGLGWNLPLWKSNKHKKVYGLTIQQKNFCACLWCHSMENSQQNSKPLLRYLLDKASKVPETIDINELLQKNAGFCESLELIKRTRTDNLSRFIDELHDFFERDRTYKRCADYAVIEKVRCIAISFRRQGNTSFKLLFDPTPPLFGDEAPSVTAYKGKEALKKAVLELFTNDPDANMAENKYSVLLFKGRARYYRSIYDEKTYENPTDSKKIVNFEQRQAELRKRREAVAQVDLLAKQLYTAVVKARGALPADEYDFSCNPGQALEIRQQKRKKHF